MWWNFPSNILAIGLVVSDCSKEILIIAVIGAASKTPITPHNMPQKIKDKIIVTGWSLRAEPINLGSITSPIIILVIVGINIKMIIGNGVVYWIKATGIGKIIAIIDPNTGMNVRKKVKLAKIIANSKSKTV